MTYFNLEPSTFPDPRYVVITHFEIHDISSMIILILIHNTNPLYELEPHKDNNKTKERETLNSTRQKNNTTKHKQIALHHAFKQRHQL